MRRIMLILLVIVGLMVYQGRSLAADIQPSIKEFNQLLETDKVVITTFSFPEMGPGRQPRFEDVEREALVLGLMEAWDWFLNLEYQGKILGNLLSLEAERSVFYNFISSITWEFHDRIDGGKTLQLVFDIKGGEFAMALSKIKYVLQFHEDIQDGFTGLIIDARGLEIKKTMSPKVYSVTGEEVYGTLNVDPDYVLEVGVVGYYDQSSLDKATERIGDHPLIVKAIGVRDEKHTVISKEAAEKIRLADLIKPFLRYCRVIILVD